MSLLKLLISIYAEYLFHKLNKKKVSKYTFINSLLWHSSAFS